MAAGILLGLTKEEHLSAFGLSADFVSGINEWAIEGTDDLYIQNGMASGNGVKAAMLAKAGVTAPHGILEGKSGFCQAYDYSLANLEAVNCADGKYVISDVLFKPAPACALVQTTAQIALDIAKQGIRPEHIDKGTILTFALGKEYAGCDFSGPFANLLQARMSNQFNFAASLAHRRISNQNYIDFRNTVVTELAARLNVAVSSAYTAEFPLRQPVQVELLLTNGETRAFFREEPVYLDSDTILEKFYEESDGIYDKNIARQVVDTILHLERLNDVNALNELLAARKRTNPR
jgi:2-methylcitrate dehydratase PrpD